jgi:membrane protease YdiL (CAAX protease family)
MKLKNVLIFFLFSLIVITTITNVSAYPDYETYEYESSYTSYNPFPIFALIIIFIIAMLCLYIYAIIWVYKDSKKRGQEPIIWILVILVGGLVGIILYLVLRKSLKPSSGDLFNISSNKSYRPRMCPACGRSIPFDAVVCPYCENHFDKHY